MTGAGANTITGYHAHVYFDADSEAAALALRDTIAASLDGKSVV